LAKWLEAVRLLPIRVSTGLRFLVDGYSDHFPAEG